MLKKHRAISENFKGKTRGFIAMGSAPYSICPSPKKTVMHSLLTFDQTTLANMTAALEYVCLKLLPDRDNLAIRKFIANEIVAAAREGQTSLGDLTAAGLNIVNSYLFPPKRSWRGPEKARPSR
jgi:hypothetical protein